MNLDELKKEAYEDLPITKEEHLDQEAFKNQELKAKWLDYKSRFELLLVRNKGGKADAKVYVAKPFDLKVLKSDLAMYISSDEEIIQLSDKISYLEYTIKYCEGIIKSIDNRGWDTKNAIEWKKFEAGMI